MTGVPPMSLVRRVEHAIIACARWESPYLDEWVAYHAALGFDRIYLYCNDDDPNDMRRVLENQNASHPGLISFTHFPGQGRQRDMYLAALYRARDEAEWVMFLDIDEFLLLRTHKGIAGFLAGYPPMVESVHFNWVYFGNNGFVERPSGSVMRQYTRRSAWVNAHTKHLTRASTLTPDRLSKATFPFWHGLADPAFQSVCRVNVLGADVAPFLADFPHAGTRYLADKRTNDAILACAVVNHYAFKSEGDFNFRVRRGLAGEFALQANWREICQNGQHLDILKPMNEVEDTFLRDFNVREMGPVEQPPATTDPKEPLRRVPVRHHLWRADLLLGSNGRVRHADHGSLGSYVLKDGVLHVHWDTWPSDLFLQKDGDLTSIDLLDTPVDLKKRLTARLGAASFNVECVTVRLPGSNVAVELRVGTSDIAVFAAIFIDHEYEFSTLPGTFNNVVDLGANTGISSLYFAQKYQAARVIAVEPEPGNFRMLRRNCSSEPRIVPVQAAIWPEDTRIRLRLRNDDGERLADWAFQATESATLDSIDVEAVSVPTIMQRYGLQSIDLLKIDIEGAERELFARETEAWLPTVRCIAIETHERFRPGVDGAIVDRLVDFEELPPNGENRVFVRRTRAGRP